HAGRRTTVIRVLIRRLRHAGEGIKQPQRALGIFQSEQHLGRGHHTSTLPNSALNNVPLDPALTDISTRIQQCKQLLGGRHRVRLNTAHQGDILLLEIWWKPVFWSEDDVEAEPSNQSTHRTR